MRLEILYGARAKTFTHEAMRGPSARSVGDRELMAAYVSQVNGSAFCVGAHTATASQAYQDGPRVAAVPADLESAPVAEPLSTPPAGSPTPSASNCSALTASRREPSIC
ncbi:carboxymuconolactone decarboxylase family protein [Streptomyces sp. NBC_01304]|uniref:carboxymuconolactone decarboxylase family protein n=1 Tax=Streptomyces sp. NBC_01304 TaxID=2903818 RepID=UPI002E11EC4D|nr:carboxymuconolactone decarboxylase family protein [Streptomyces sp. NBC_01304]